MKIRRSPFHVHYQGPYWYIVVVFFPPNRRRRARLKWSDGILACRFFDAIWVRTVPFACVHRERTLTVGR